MIQALLALIFPVVLPESRFYNRRCLYKVIIILLLFPLVRTVTIENNSKVKKYCNFTVLHALIRDFNPIWSACLYTFNYNYCFSAHLLVPPARRKVVLISHCFPCRTRPRYCTDLCREMYNL